MTKITNGMKAGFLATGVLSLLMLVKSAMGIMPALDVVNMLSAMMGMPDAPIVGWMAHFAIGTIMWGTLFAVLAPHLPGTNYTLKGMFFGIMVWLLMMIMVMPAAGLGLFGMTLLLHLMFGMVLGAAYGMSARKLIFGNMK